LFFPSESGPLMVAWRGSGLLGCWNGRRTVWSWVGSGRAATMVDWATIGQRCSGGDR
jgi:hypothetical protein